MKTTFKRGTVFVKDLLKRYRYSNNHSMNINNNTIRNNYNNNNIISNSVESILFSLSIAKLNSKGKAG
jgi:hypothetical protein